MTRCENAVQLWKFLNKKLLSLTPDHVFDDVWSKMFQSWLSLIDISNADVRVVIALHRQEEAVERVTQIVGVENGSDEVIWIAASGELGATSDCPFFQLELVEDCHCMCESFCLKILY